MKVLIIGGGNLGYYLAKNLLEKGDKVKVIEIDRERCEFIADELNIPVITGDGTRLEVLSQAKPATFDAVVVVTGKDEDNLIACELVKKQFGVKKTVSRSNNPKNVSLLKKMGIDIVVNTTQIITDLVGHEIDGAAVQVMANISNSDAVISEYKIPDDWKLSGKCVMELDIPLDCVLIYILRNDSLTIPRGNTVIMAGDEVTALAIGAADRKLKKIFGIS